MQLACISNGTVINTTYTTLSGQHPGCDGATHLVMPAEILVTRQTAGHDAGTTKHSELL